MYPTHDAAMRSATTKEPAGSKSGLQPGARHRAATACQRHPTSRRYVRAAACPPRAARAKASQEARHAARRAREAHHQSGREDVHGADQLKSSTRQAPRREQGAQQELARRGRADEPHIVITVRATQPKTSRCGCRRPLHLITGLRSAKLRWPHNHLRRGSAPLRGVAVGYARQFLGRWTSRTWTASSLSPAISIDSGHSRNPRSTVARPRDLRYLPSVRPASPPAAPSAAAIEGQSSSRSSTKCASRAGVRFSIVAPLCVAARAIRHAPKQVRPTLLTHQVDGQYASSTRMSARQAVQARHAVVVDRCIRRLATALTDSVETASPSPRSGQSNSSTSHPPLGEFACPYCGISAARDRATCSVQQSARRLPRVSRLGLGARDHRLGSARRDSPSTWEHCPYSGLSFGFWNSDRLHRREVRGRSLQPWRELSKVSATSSCTHR